MSLPPDSPVSGRVTSDSVTKDMGRAQQAASLAQCERGIQGGTSASHRGCYPLAGTSRPHSHHLKQSPRFPEFPLSAGVWFTNGLAEMKPNVSTGLQRLSTLSTSEAGPKVDSTQGHSHSSEQQST